MPKFLSQGLLLGEPQLQQKTRFPCWKGSGRETHSSRGWYEQYRGAQKSEVLSKCAPSFSKSSSKRKHYLFSDYLKMFPSRMIGMELAAPCGKGRKPCSWPPGNREWERKVRVWSVAGPILTPGRKGWMGKSRAILFAWKMSDKYPKQKSCTFHTDIPPPFLLGPVLVVLPQVQIPAVTLTFWPGRRDPSCLLSPRGAFLSSLACTHKKCLQQGAFILWNHSCLWSNHCHIKLGN